MDVQLTPDQSAYVRDAISSGRLSSVDEAVREALKLWETRERARAQLLGELDVAEVEIKDGYGRQIADRDAHQHLHEDGKRSGRARIEAEKKAQR